VDSNGLYITVRFASDLRANTALQLSASLDLPENLSVPVPDDLSLAVLVLEPSTLSSAGGSGVLAGRLEAHAGYFPDGDSCTIADSSSNDELLLLEWGVPDLALGRIPLPEGRMGTASDGQSGDVCIIRFRFENVPEYSIYMVAQVGAGQIDVCRACVLGLMTASQGAEQVIVRA
jgi:hypothetical protein